MDSGESVDQTVTTDELLEDSTEHDDEDTEETEETEMTEEFEESQETDEIESHIDDDVSPVTETPKPSKEGGSKDKKSGKTVLSGRGVTLKMLVDDGILDVEDGCMSIDYLGQKFVADLLPNGKIKWEGSNKLFNSPSAWAIHCKKLVNPSKKSGCGWASVKYRGKKLDQYKANWFRKQRPLFQSNKTSSATSSTKKITSPNTTPKSVPTSVVSPPISSSQSPLNQPLPGQQTSPTTSNQRTGHLSPSHISPPRLVSPTDRLHSPPSLLSDEPPTKKPSLAEHKPGTSFPKISHQSSTKKELSQRIKNKVQKQSKKSRLHQHKSGNLPTPPPLKTQKKQESKSDLADLSSFASPRKTKLVSWPRTSIKISELHQDSDPLTLVECLTFAGQKKTQPFTVSINTNSLMLMDLHCHLTTSEVVGYLGGHWQRDTHHIQVVQAFPVKCRFADQKNAENVEEEIRLAMKVRGLVVVGWYHSHPTYQPDPSARDIAAQQHYQKCLKLERFSYDPCVGFIISPYDPHLSSRESVIKAFWVQSVESAGVHSTGYPLPMTMDYTIQASGLLTDDLLTEMRLICSYYKGSPDAVEFTETWLSGVTFLDKVKASLMKKFPKDQSNRLFRDDLQCVQLVENIVFMGQLRRNLCKMTSDKAHS